MDPKNGNNTTRNKSSTIFKDINVNENYNSTKEENLVKQKISSFYY